MKEINFCFSSINRFPAQTTSVILDNNNKTIKGGNLTHFAYYKPEMKTNKKLQLYFSEKKWKI